MKRCAILFLAATLSAVAGEVAPKVSVLDSAVLCVRTMHAADNLSSEIRAAEGTNHLSGTVLDLRFADAADTNAAAYLSHQKSPLVILVNSQTRGEAAALATQLRQQTATVVIGSSSPAEKIVPDIAVAVSVDDEKKFQDNPFLEAPTNSTASVSGTNNLLAFVDHTSEAELVRKRVKDAEDDGSPAAPRTNANLPIVRDPALARAVDLLKALALLQKPRG